MLLTILFDDDLEDGVINALYQIGPYVVQIKQRPPEGRKETQDADIAEQAGVTPGPFSSSTGGKAYVSNTPNVGFCVWSSSFVLADYLFRHKPFPSWDGIRVLELGAGTGVLGIALALAGANVTITDLPYIIPLAQENVDSNCSGLRTAPSVVAYQWGEDATHLGPPPQLIVAADVLYEERYYQDLLATLVHLCTPDTPFFTCYRKRKLNEELFEQLSREAGAVVEHVPQEHLGTEFHDGGYRIIQLTFPSKSGTNTAEEHP